MLKLISGIIKPKKFTFVSVKATIEISVTKTVSKYMSSALIKMLKMPRLIMFTGKLIMLRMGFIIRKSIVSTNPPVKSVQNPPFT